MAGGAESVSTELIGRLERAWNEADSRASGEPFSADADFITIRGEQLPAEKRSRLGPGHLRFDLRGQQHRIRADGCQGAFGQRDPGPRYGGPQGPIRSPRRRAQSGANLGLVQGGDGWEIAGFHNTLVAPQQ